jgi:signal transduction histidine kinase
MKRSVPNPHSSVSIRATQRIAHDIGGLLTCLEVSAADLIEATSSEESIHSNQLRTACVLIREVLDSELDHVNSRVREKTCNLSLIVASVIQSELRLWANSPVITLTGKLPTVLGDPATVRRCVANLVNNALKFHRPGVAPVGRIRTRTIGDRIRLYVSDNGIGVSPERRRKLFRRKDPDHFDDRPGHQIGLSGVRVLVDRIGGKVGMETSHVGAGSCFWLEFLLPLPVQTRVFRGPPRNSRRFKLASKKML